MTSTDRLRAALADRYKIEREIGSGGMATVYLAEDLKHHRQVAVKVLRPDIAASLGADRFVREIEVAARLEHPHILTLIDSGEADGFLFFVMPFVEGQSLRAKLRHGELPVAEALRVLRDVTDALAYAHSKGLVHRDIKPDNVLLSGHHAVVTDFGVAKAVSEATGRQELTTAGVALGTPTYMAPEQAAADPHIDHRADIYALGVLAYELVTGTPPFTGPSVQAVLAAQVTQRPTPVSEVRPAVPPALDELIMRCLEKKAADRWQSAGEILGRLEAATTPSLGVTPTDTQPVTAQVVSRRRKRTVLAVVGSAAVVGLFAVGAILLPGEEGPPLDPQRVVVAIFDNETGDPAQDGIGKMAQDWLTQGLQQTGVVSVVPTPSARQAAAYIASEIGSGNRVDPVLTLASETGAGTVVSGAFYRDGATLRFQAQVTNANNGELIGALDPVTGPMDSASVVVERLRQRLMGFLAVRLDERLAAATGASGRPPTFEAYQEFSDGMDEYLRYENSEALQNFLRAFELDTSFAVPLIYAGLNAMNLGVWDRVDSITAILEGRRDRLSEYHRRWVDYLHARSEGDNDAAIIAMRHAAELAPGSKAVYNLAFSLERGNRPAEALETMQQLDPDRGPMRGWKWYWVRLAYGNHLLGNYEAELTVARRAQEYHPDDGTIASQEIRALAALGDTAALFDRTVLRPSASPLTDAQLLEAVVRELRTHGGDREAAALADTALSRLARYEPQPGEEFEYRTLVSVFYFVRGDVDSALARAAALVSADGSRLFAPMIDGTQVSAAGGVWSAHGWYGYLAARTGDRDLATREVAWLADRNRRHSFGAPYWWSAAIAGALGDRDEAVRLLQLAVRKGMFPGNMHDDIELIDVLGDYAPFRELIEPQR